MDLLSRLVILTIFSPMKENEKFSHKCIHPKHFRVSGIKISNVTKETSQILLQTPWHLRKPQINLVSLCGNSFTDVKKVGKVCIRANVAHQAGAYPGFRSMKRLGVFLPPPGWDASPSQGYPPALSSPVPIYTPGWREAL